ncbi:hypothetical protein J2Z49_002433 [Desulfofundulus luciae]|uniref:Uncharacterized protein n=1 Tax=Desulfofundulus luciae TaxID=74702 RepID=A0ABU0B3M0_9FIRM|nr:hypothetical protein [Desulfofundulus luciae]MDQ0287312.1 hypothetical protein [Desulfofundulus luciae]
MKILSPGGELVFSLSGLEVKEAHLILKGRMGIWDAEGYISRDEIITLIRLCLRPRLLGGLLAILLGFKKS